MREEFLDVNSPLQRLGRLWPNWECVCKTSPTPFQTHPGWGSLPARAPLAGPRGHLGWTHLPKGRKGDTHPVACTRREETAESRGAAVILEDRSQCVTAGMREFTEGCHVFLMTDFLK